MYRYDLRKPSQTLLRPTRYMLVQTTYEPSQTFADFAKADTVHASASDVKALANLRRLC